VTSGAVRAKVLDFGLAKPIAEAVESAPTVSVDDTADGRILGTPAYMSPEQAPGLPVDRRTDIWAFGWVLYELLTGARAFRGHTTSELMVSILTLEPDLSRLPGTVPPSVVDLLQRCLMKDPRERLRDIGDARNDLREVSVQAPGASSLPKSRFAWQRAATAAIGVAAFGLAAWGVVAAVKHGKMVSGVTIVSRPGAVRASKAVSTHREATPSIIRESQLSAPQLGTQDRLAVSITLLLGLCSTPSPFDSRPASASNQSRNQSKMCPRQAAV
jgi:eukaryotic-like serine/threonine-protein kinase